MSGGSPRVALVHDWLVGMRGGEKVLEVFANLFPQATIYTLLHKPGSVSQTIESHPIRTSLLQQMPLARDRYRYYLPLLPTFAETMTIEPVDLVISISHCVAKGIVPPEGARHVSYVLSPMRYIYDRYDDYFSQSRSGLLTRTAMSWCRGPLQRWDKRSTKRVDEMVGISEFISERIERIYGRQAGVIHPPVEVERFAQARRASEDYYLIVSALVPYKNVDVAVEAFRGLDRRLVVVGDGPVKEQLEADCPPNVTLKGWVDDEELPSLVAGCRAFIFPNVEDFGIAPLEAMAAGRPVIALGQGGARDTVRDLDRFAEGRLDGGDGPTGLFFDEPTPEAIARAVVRFEAEEDAFHPSELTAWTRRFDTDCFTQKIRDWVGGESTVQPRRMAA
ncbi:GDP-mannose-dependent alpha-(1-6)-phosphatidylinositol monomannoside mannosyltransferase [Planctomycetes bacterium Pan216]|uniref:GDP-mannose-dependent alpha-(1-6)-phosphatidylinositol monomannoside mannosyltransferase n=1 Tax=Kolteria novifilia TaxID=2527975 RepID=A0A518B6A1_9BACT|nr:GDP-mannose-dependent alpha-(1-6)-phosphatidylinositol monomannoside mannosyltransferase [Planctomycetes bacterium Pan216]